MGDFLGYMRVSTYEQDLQSQRDRLTTAGAKKIFHDIISGKTFERPGLTSLFEYARPGDVLVVVRLDRLGRSLKELLETVEALKKRGIQFMSLEEKIDTSSAAGELVFHIFGSIAHFERRLISERTKDGIRSAKARGKLPGRPPLSEETRQAAKALIDSGMSPALVAKQLGIGRSTIYREICNRR
ncbi:MAG: recombinase family protein [Oligoflexus sp.]